MSDPGKYLRTLIYHLKNGIGFVLRTLNGTGYIISKFEVQVPSGSKETSTWIRIHEI